MEEDLTNLRFGPQDDPPIKTGNLPLVAVVDDEPMICHWLARSLRTGGFEATTYNDACKALAALDSGVHFDLILLDVRMPDMNGIDALRQFKTRQPSLPVLMLTGSPDQETAIEAMQAGAAHYLIKPVHITTGPRAIPTCRESPRCCSTTTT